MTPPRDRGVSRPGGQGSKFYVLCSEPKEHKSFGLDTRPGGPVTEVTGQSFMCQSFMCLFCSLLKRKEKMPTKEQGFFYRTLKVLGKEGEKRTKKPKEILESKKTQQSKRRTIIFLWFRDMLCPQTPGVSRWKKFISRPAAFVADFSWNFLRPPFLEIEGRKSANIFVIFSSHFSPMSAEKLKSEKTPKEI